MSQQQKRPTLSSPDKRPRKNSAEYLDNKQFAYLLDETRSDDEISTSSPIPNNKISPTLINGAKNRKKNKDRYRKPRTSSIQIETTKTQNQQLQAIKKEVEFLKSEVPHFNDIHSATQLQWSNTKRKNKAESEAFSLIQTLTQWIHLYGNKAVTEYDEFKQSAEKEILSMVHKMEKINHENTKLNLLFEESENEKQEALNSLNVAQREIIKYKKAQSQLNQDKQSKELNKNTINDLENELEAISSSNKTVTEKYERVEKYWKMTQAENDELRNKNYAIEEEIIKLKNELKQNQENMNAMNIKHEKVIKKLQIEHQSYAHQMQEEQEKLIAAQQNINEEAHNIPTGYTINADDSDIVGSGITDDVDDDYDGMGGIVSLENEFNVYQYEDDEWLDDTDSDMEGDYDEPEPEALPQPQIYNKQSEFEMEKRSDFHDIVYSDISKGYKTSKIVFCEEKKQPIQFESQSIKIEVKPQKKQLDLMMSSTQISHTPQMSTPDALFENSRQKHEELNKSDLFELSSSGIMQQKNELVDRNSISTNRIIIERGAKKEDKAIEAGTNFAERLAMFKYLDETRGGKPQILSHSKAYELMNKWQSQNKNIELNIESKNVHITKSTVPHIGDSKKRGQQINVLKITKTKAHTLKPRLFGYINIIRSSFIPRWKATQKPRYFFVLDGLPSQTNINQKEPDFAKNRKHDFLVPTLFFFQSKDDYDTFEAQVKDVPTRNVEFQKLFAKYAKGIFPLNTFAMEVNISSCVERVNRLNKRNDIKLPNSEINACGTIDDLTILMCNDNELHKFYCNDKVSRNKWIKKVNKLVDKRSKRLSNINSGLMNVYDEYGNRKVAALDTPNPTGLDSPAMVIGASPNTLTPGNNPYNIVDNNNIITRNNRASMVKLGKIKQVEAEFD